MSVNALQEKNERNAHKFFHKVKEFLKRFETLRTLYYKFIANTEYKILVLASFWQKNQSEAPNDIQ